VRFVGGVHSCKRRCYILRVAVVRRDQFPFGNNTALFFFVEANDNMERFIHLDLYSLYVKYTRQVCTKEGVKGRQLFELR